MSRVGVLVGAVCAITALALSFVNGIVMLISPRLFFSLPTWLSAKGRLTKERYGSGFGAIQVRLLGAVFAGGPLWLICHLVRQKLN